MRLSILCATVAMLAACATNGAPPIKITRLAVPEDQTQRVATMTMVLLGNASAVGGAGNAPGVAGVTAAAVVGQNPLSAAGRSVAGTVGGALTVMSWLSATETYMSAFFVPEGVAATAAEAERYAAETLGKRINTWAASINGTASCVAHCDKRSRTYRVDITGRKEPLFVTQKLFAMIPVQSNAEFDAVLGFRPAWRTGNIDGARTCLAEYDIRKTDGTYYAFASVAGEAGPGPVASTRCEQIKYMTDLNLELYRTMTNGSGKADFATGYLAEGRGYLAMGSHVYDVVTRRTGTADIRGELTTTKAP